MQYIIQNNKNHWNHIPNTPLAWKKLPKKGHFAHISNEIKICSQNKCHHHLSNVCENSFRMFHSNWVISDYHSFIWQFEFPWLNLTNCWNKWMLIRNDPVTVKHTKWIFTDVGKVMMAFILATDFDFIAYMSKMDFFSKLFSRQWRFWNMINKPWLKSSLSMFNWNWVPSIWTFILVSWKVCETMNPTGFTLCCLCETMVPISMARMKKLVENFTCNIQC